MSTIERDAVSGLSIVPATGALAGDAAEPSPLLGGDRPTCFYIQSEVHNSDWVISRNAEGKVRLAHKTGALSQLWTREDDPRGGFFLVNAENGQVLFQTRPQGGEVTLAKKTLDDSRMLWRLESYRGQWSGINAFNDWEQKLNIAGNGPYDENSPLILWEYSKKSPNECWQMIADTGLITVESITYDMPKASVSFLQPSLCVATTVDNRDGAIPLQTTVRLARTISSSRQFSYGTQLSETFKIAEKLGVKLAVEKVVEFSGEFAVERTTGKTTTFGEQTTQTETVSDDVAVTVTVPPHLLHRFQVRVSYGKVTVPYTATISRVLPNNQKKVETVTGEYTNVSATRFDILAVDATNGTPGPAQILPAPSGAELPHF